MKKRLLFLMITFIILLSACSNINVKYKRIVLTPQALGEAQSNAERTIAAKTNIVNQASESYSENMPIYKISPYEITEKNLIDFAAFFGVHDAVQYDDIGMSIKIENESDTGKELVAAFRVSDNLIVYRNTNSFDCGEMMQSDEDLEEEAKRVFESLPIIEGEYEFIGQTATTTVSDSEGSYTVRKEYSFQPVLNGVRVIGDNYCTLYFNANGLCRIELNLYSYEQAGEMDMISLDTAIKQIKKPDAFTTYNEQFKGTADSLCIERTKLLYVNQYSNGCEILQPVYNLMGTATNESCSSEFSAKIIAIPEKYTYD